MPTCPGGLIEHADGTILGCTEDDERDGCRGRDLRHEGDPIRCWVWTLADPPQDARPARLGWSA